MSNIKGSRHEYWHHKWFWEGIYLHRLFKENEGLTFNQLSKKYNITTTSTVIKRKFDVEVDVEDSRKITGVLIDKVVKSENGGIRHYTEVNKELLEIGLTLLEEFDPDYISKNLNFELMRRGFKMENNKIVKVEENNIVVDISIDNGNTDAKVVAGVAGLEEKKEFIFESKAKQESYSDVEKNTNDYIYIDGNELFFIGRKFDNAPSTTRKAQKNNRPIFLYSICRAIKELGLNVDKVDVNVMLSNPIDELQDFETLKQELEGCSNTICECRVDGQASTTQINIKSIKTIAEGVASWMTIEDTTGSDLLIDIGSKTLNWVLSNDDTIEIADTIQWGVNKYFEKLGIKYGLSLDEIKRVAGKKKFEHDEELFGVYLNEVISKVEADCKVKGFVGIDNIWFTGGGTELAEIIGVDIESADETYRVIPEARMSNVRGAFEMMKGE